MKLSKEIRNEIAGLEAKGWIFSECRRHDPGATSMSGRVYSDPFWVVRYRNSDGTLRGNGDSADSCDDAARKAIGAVLLHIAREPPV